MTDRLEQLRQLAQADPADAPTRFLLGREAAEQALWEEARAAFAAALELDPDYSAAYRQLGNCLERLERPAEAAGVYERGREVAARRGDLQAAKEMAAFLTRLRRDGRI